MASSLPRFRVVSSILLTAILGALFYYLSLEARSLWSIEDHLKTTNSKYNESSNRVTITVDKSDFDLTPLRPLPGEQTSDRWVVVTTIQKPTDDMRLLGEMSKYGWRVLAVGDKSTPADWIAPPGVRFLSHAEASKLPYNLMRYHKWKVYAAKNVGYMFAIHHGAKIIYDTDDDNHPLDQLKSMLDFAGVEFDGLEGSLPRAVTRALYFDAPQSAMPVINPLPHFGQSLLWPRGYPLREISKSPLRNYRLCSTRPPAWIQGVVNGDPDVDAIFRLTRKHFRTEINMTFDKATPVMAPQGYYIQTNSQNTLFVQTAIPFIFLPYTVTMRETDIWRAYIGQRLLWIAGSRKGYVAPNAFQARNPHDYLKDFKDEMKLYVDVEDLVRSLQDWRCPDHFDLGDCLEEIYRHLASSQFKFVLEQDASAAAAWVADLRRMQYPFPKREELQDCLDVNYPVKTGRNSRLQARLYPVEQETTLTAHSKLANALSPRRTETKNYLLGYCSRAMAKTNIFSPNWQPKSFQDSLTLLVSLSSMARPENLVAMAKRIDLLYKGYVPRILFCVPKQFLNNEIVLEAAERLSISMIETIPFNPSKPKMTSRAEAAADCLQTAFEIRLHGNSLVYMAADAHVLITPQGLDKMKSASTSEPRLSVLCADSDSPLVVAMTRSVFENSISVADLKRYCSSSETLIKSPCPESPIAYPSHVDVYTGCVNIAEDKSFATQCSIFVESKRMPQLRKNAADVDQETSVNSTKKYNLSV